MDPVEYYSTPGMMTDPQEYAGLIESLPTDIASLSKIVQGLMIHIFWAERYGVTLPEERKEEAQIRPVSQKLKRILELDNRPLIEARPFSNRLVGNCRDFSTLFCSFLRHQGVPARARCGFGAYFMPNHYEDHWVCEYWNKEEERWVMVDAQLDPFQQEKLDIRFDTLNVPRGQFLTGGKAWQMCRADKADPDQFGIFDLHGMWFVRGNLLRDLASLNKIELLPWDGWGLADKDEKALSSDDIQILDHVAILSQADNKMFQEMRFAYENDVRLRVPPVIKSYTASGVRLVQIADQSKITTATH